MQMLEGAPIGEQIAVGKLHFFRREPYELQERSDLPWQEEDGRFLCAQSHAARELLELYDRAGHELGEEEASIFAIHAMLVEDEDLTRRVRDMIRRGCTAQFAVHTVGNEVMETFARMDSAYMRARAADIRDITRRMILRLLDIHPDRSIHSEAVILVSDSFMPSEIMELDRRRILGLITTGGSVDSHTAQILRYCRIPTLVGMQLPQTLEGHTVLMDCHTGRLYVDPTVELTEQLRRDYERNGCPGGAQACTP